MSLLSEAMGTCRYINRAVVSDGEGGTTTVYTNGAKFKAAIRLDNSMQARIAEVQGVKSLYTIITDKSINLQYNDIVERQSDNKTFRVTSDGDDDKTPNSANMNMRAVSAEEWVIPRD